jgi:hypothetical protein
MELLGRAKYAITCLFCSGVNFRGSGDTVSGASDLGTLPSYISESFKILSCISIFFVLISYLKYFFIKLIKPNVFNFFEGTLGNSTKLFPSVNDPENFSRIGNLK